MTSLAVIVPGCIDTISGGYEYDRRMIAGLRAAGWSVVLHQLDSSFPNPTAAARQDAARVLAGIAEGGRVLIDGLALGAMPEEVLSAARKLRLIALVHHPLARESGIDRADALRLFASERNALALVERIVVTSRATASALAEYGIESDRIAVVEPGTDASPIAGGSGAGMPTLLCVAALVPRKGHAVLFDALAAVRGYDWRLVCVGSMTRDVGTADRLSAQLLERGLTDRVRLVGEVDRAALAKYYDGADVFVLPTLYEGYGMVVAEALACGLPVISTRTGAIEDLVADEAGYTVPPGDVNAFAQALSLVLGDTSRLRRLRDGAARVRQRLPSWDVQCARMAEAIART